MTIRPAAAGEHVVCERILRALPDWFGIESSLLQYVRDTQTLPTWFALDGDEPVGFVTLREHNPRSAEIHVIGVLPTHHRRGVGRGLVEFCEGWLRARGVEYLQVKTQGPSRPCEFYDRTRRFYEGVGFAPLEEFAGVWPGIPCLVLVKRL